MSIASTPKPLFWVGSTLEDVRRFPKEVRDAIGFALFQAHKGGKHINAKPLSGFGGGGVLEVVDDHDGDTYRAVYTVRFRGAVYALHAFQKKAKKGIQTPKQEMDLVRRRLKRAAELHSEWLARGEKSGIENEDRGSRK